MCGIAGILGIAPERAGPAAERMLVALKHRGPDADGIQAVADPTGVAPPAVLVHTRLAIIDLSPAGRQPMADAMDPGPHRPWIVFNGEIYNFQEVRAELAKHGLVARTGTDTEVILLAYRLWGPAAVERFRGMFAFALADPARGRVWLARDRLGIKPLYWRRPTEGGLLFASEVRALLAAGPELTPPRLCPRALESFLAQGAVYGNEAHIEGVQALGPGETLTTDWSGNVIETRRYWDLPFVQAGAPVSSRPDAVSRLGAVAREAVRQHLIADVPVGVFLSSGIDSTAVATLATEVAAGRVRTISIGFDRPEFDETAVAEQFARELETDHKVVRIAAADIRADFDQVLAAIDQPTVDGFNTYYVSRAARQAGLTVALSGLGGDEVFGGSASFRDVPRAGRWLRVARPRWLVGPAARWLSMRLGSRGALKFAEAMARPIDPVQLYLLRRELFLPAERRSLFPLPAESDPLTGLTSEALEALTRQAAGLDAENRVSALELTGYMRHMLLRDADVFSMAHGLELRVPLLDHELVGAAAGMPGAWKRPGTVSKRLLIDAAGPRLPRRAATLPKRGFTFPWPDWFRGDLANIARDRLTDRGSSTALGIDPAAPGKLWNRFRQRDPAVGGLHILALVVLADMAVRQRLSAG